MPRRLRIHFWILLTLALLLLSARDGMAQFNGYPSSYYPSPNRGLPTYMTSINYPRIYGSFEYPYPSGIVQPGLQRNPFTTNPTIYSVSTAPPSAGGPGENTLNSAMT